MGKIYGYCRISRRTQKIERQVQNILKAYPNAEIKQEAYTGTKIKGREKFEKLLKSVEAGDTIVFDSVSRMSRNADEGVQTYFALYDRGISLVFLKEPYINTDTYSNLLQDRIELTGTDADEIIMGINNYFRRLARNQIQIAFEQSQKEIDDLHERTKEGIRVARAHGKQIGQVAGRTLNVKKKEPIKAKIKEKSKDFYGTYTDKDLIKILGIARNTYYKYKKELAAELNGETNNSDDHNKH